MLTSIDSCFTKESWHGVGVPFLLLDWTYFVLIDEEELEWWLNDAVNLDVFALYSKQIVQNVILLVILEAVLYRNLC